MYRIAVMGDRDSVYGFASLGLDVYPVSDSDEASTTIRRLAETDYEVIYITEELAAKLTAEVEHFADMISPAIITIPGIRGNTGAGIAMVKKSVERAVGSDIIFNEKN